MVKKIVAFRLLFEMAKVKKSNFQATLPHCTPVLVRKTAPKRFGTKENRERPVKLVVNELLLGVSSSSVTNPLDLEAIITLILLSKNMYEILRL